MSQGSILSSNFEVTNQSRSGFIQPRIDSQQHLFSKQDIKIKTKKKMIKRGNVLSKLRNAIINLNLTNIIKDKPTLNRS